MKGTAKKAKTRIKRSWRVRKNLNGTATKPRLCVVKSNKHVQAHLIDDENHKVLGGATTYSKEFRGTEIAKKSKAAGRKIGERIAEIAKEKGVQEVVFDRGWAKYHGVLAELAEGARAGGLKF